MPDRGPTPPDGRPFRALIAGAGVAGLEAALALHDLAGDAVDVTLLAREPTFAYRPMRVREPFSYAAARHYPVDRIAADAGAELVQDSLGWVDTAARTVHTTSGRALRYDALLLALGATTHDRFPHATTIDDRHLDEIFRGVIQDVEGGYVHRIAFVMPSERCWPLPLYELALMTAERAFAMGVDVHITIVTPERTPLAVFGTEASGAVASLLEERGIAVEAHARAQVPSGRRVVIDPGDRTIDVDRVVALPELRGPGVRGLLGGDDGFVPVDEYCRVRGTDRLFAAGDATDYPVKHGGLSSLQADTAVREIARLAGVTLDAQPFHPRIDGMLLTGRAPLYISATVVGGSGFRSRVGSEPLWSPATKIAARYLAPYLDRLDAEADRAPAGPVAASPRR
jgi:sulfide:quinone oxidoreductase